MAVTGGSTPGERVAIDRYRAFQRERVQAQAQAQARWRTLALLLFFPCCWFPRLAVGAM